MNDQRQTIITSAANPAIKRLAALQQKARLRAAERVFIAEGTRLFLDTPPEMIESLYVTERFLAEGPEEAAAKARAACAAVLTEQLMAKVSGTEHPQGVLAVVRMREWTLDEILGAACAGTSAGTSAGITAAGASAGVHASSSVRDARRAPLLVLLENVRDPGNLGTIVRTAEAAGADGIIMSRGTADIYNPKAVRSTMSALYRVPHLYADDLPALIRRLQSDEGITVYAAHLGASESYDEQDYTRGCAFLVGNEASGLTDEASGAAAGRILIPMAGGIESLNASVAAAVLLFEAARQRRAGHGR